MRIFCWEGEFMGKFIYFTEEQKERVRATNLVSYLKNNGYKLDKQGSEYVWESPEGKVTISGNRWYHHYDQEGGYVIHFFERFFNMTFQETMLMLLEEQGIACEQVKQEEQKEKKAFELPKRNDSMRRIYAYLLKERFLDREVIQYFIQKKLIYEDAKYHNVVFVGLDEEGVARHAHKRGTNSKSGFKGNVESSNPNYSFHHIGTSNRIYVFEAPIDMLSYISLHKANWKEHSYVSLCSVAPHALIHILQNNPSITEVRPCLDHDEAGIAGDYRIAEAVRELGEYKITAELPKYKDWNEGAKALQGVKAIPSSEHPGLVKMKALCPELVEGCEGIQIKNLLDNLQKRFEKLNSIPLSQDDRLSEQSYELAWIAFLFGKNKLDAMEKKYTKEEYSKMLYQLYPPHKDKSGYKSRIAELGENLSEVVRAYKKDEILPESEHMKLIKKVMQLSVDFLRLHMYAEVRLLKQEVGENACQMSQA